MLNWNNNTRRYEAQVGDDFIEVDGDAFAEAEQEMRATYVASGMSEDDAARKAWDNLKDASAWMSTPTQGLFINGEDRGEQ